VNKRIKRENKKGWRKPDGAIIVDGKSHWRNPFPASVYGDQDAVDRYRAYMRELKVVVPGKYRELIEPLVGHDLVCSTSEDKPSHADVLLELAAEMKKEEKNVN
jgi:hypothetical protein